jgi:hypothetical protein
MVLPTPYPVAFDISFVTNITTTGYDDSIGSPIGGKLMYDWSLRSQRIDHDTGSYECIHFYQTNYSCSLLFIPPKGMYRLIHRNNRTTDATKNGPRRSALGDRYHTSKFDAVNIGTKDIDCCLDKPDLETPPPDWATKLIDPTYDGIVYDSYSNFVTYQWSFINNMTTEVRTSLNYHTHREIAIGTTAKNAVNIVGRPILFSFPGLGSNGSQDYHYDPYSMNISDQDPNLFQLPYPECYNVMCEQSSLSIRN